jgi:serine/threonine-protein kinase
MRALHPDPAGRHEDAKVFADDLQAFLEGTKEREFRAREASGLVAEARKLVERARTLLQEAGDADRSASDLRKNLPRWAPESEKERLWKSEDAAARARVEAADTHARATDLASRALALDERHAEARAMLAGLYLDRFLDAERRGHAEEAAWLRRMVERYDDGDVGLHLQQRASVAVETDPPGAEVVLARVVERGRRRVESDAHVLGHAPRSERDLVPGDWALRLRGPGGVAVNVPLRLGRGENRTVRVRMPRPAEVPPGFVVVPGGPFLAGVAPETAETEVGDFAIMELPVRLADYALWLDELAQGGADETRPHLPWVESHGGLLEATEGRHVFAAPAPTARKPFAAHPELPVVGVSRASAEAYAEWLGRKLGVVLRIPTEREWEKAARGTDGRMYPWGDHFDPTFCSMADSTPGEPNLRPAGAFAADVSPYGVRDMAGGVREWCRDRVDEGRELAVCRGGAWYLRGRECAVTSRWIVDAETRNPGIGFRLCCEIPSS